MSRAMNVRRIKILVWLLTFVVAAASGFQFFKLYAAQRAGEYQFERRSTFEEYIATGANAGAEPLPPPPAAKHFARLWDSPINGYQPKVQEPEKPKAPVETKRALKPIDEVLSVKNILFSSNGVSLAYIRYTDDSNPAVSVGEEVLEVGANLKYPYDEEPHFGSVAQILADGVEFNWGGEKVTVSPAKLEDQPSKPKTPSSSVNTKGLTDREKEVLARHKNQEKTLRLTELGPENFLIGSRDRAMFANNTDAVLRDVRIREVPNPKGTGKEVVLSTVRQSYQRTYGVQNNDTLVSINGTPVTSKTQAINWVRQNPDLPKYSVVIRRKGRLVTKTFLVPQE